VNADAHDEPKPAGHPSRSTGSPSIGRGAFLVVLFLAALFLPARALDLLVPHEYPEPIRTQFAHYAEHKEDYDVLLIGSSLIRNQIDTDVFDRVMAEEGAPLTAFNFGVGGMRFHEFDELLDHLLALNPKRLKYVVLDMGRFDRSYPEKDFFTRRYIWWHTPAESWSAFLRDWESDKPRDEKRRYLESHYEHAALRVLNIGVAPWLVRRWTGRERFDPTRPQPIVDRVGYIPLEPGVLGERMNVEDYRAMLAQFRRDTQTTEPLNPADRRALKRQVAKLRAHGVEPVYLITPIVMEETKVKDAAAKGVIPNLFAYDDPDTYPGFYAVENRWDEYHLDRFSAADFTAVFARDFAAFVKERR
jgi:hypothetical protein